MKKKLFIILQLIVCNIIYSQTFTTVISGSSTSPTGRAPQGSMRYIRNLWLITAAEMAAAGYTSGSVFNGLGFNYSVAQNVATTGSFTVYKENTADATNLKSNDWPTAIATMTTVSNSNITIPATVGTYDIAFTGGTVFTYTGGALYIAFDYQNQTGTLATTNNTAMCNTALAGGLRGVTSTVNFPPTTLASSSFRPETRIGVQSLGITEFEKTNILVYPNPTTDFVTIFGGNQMIEKITVVSSFGKNIFVQSTINKNTFELNATNYQAGIYI